MEWCDWPDHPFVFGSLLKSAEIRVIRGGFFCMDPTEDSDMQFLDGLVLNTSLPAMTALTVSKRGTITIPVSLRRKLGLRKVAGAKLQIEEREGGVFLRPINKAVSPGNLDLLAGFFDKSPAAVAERAAFIKQVTREYTPQVCAQTLRINEEFPIHDDVP